MKHFLSTFTICMTLALLAIILVGSRRDDSDPPGGGTSGMDVLTDHLTGCQYLGRAFGGITPRMGPDGKQICRTKPVVIGRE